jgi:hypothetical protein
LPLNEWSHCVATLINGTDLKMYINGAQVKTTTLNYNTAVVKSDTRVAIGVDLPGGDEKYIGYYSDFRIYATALSAADVKQLYDTAGIVDNANNEYVYEYNEKGNLLDYADYPGTQTNLTAVFTRTVVDDPEAPTGKAVKLECTTAGSGYYFNNAP